MFKINIADKSGKTYKLELETEFFLNKELHDKIDGKNVLPDLEGYELEITGTSDKSGFTSMKDVPGIGLKKVLLTYGKAMKRKPRKEGKKKSSTPKPKGLRLRKTVRGRVISSEITQINLKVIKEGGKKLSQVFESQAKPAETETAPAEAPKESPKEETKPEPAPKGPEQPVKEKKPEEAHTSEFAPEEKAKPEEEKKII